MRLPRSTRSTRNHRAIFSIVLFAAVLLAAVVSEANEPEVAPSAEPKEKPACRYSEHESRLMSYMARIRGLEKEIADMIHSKHHVENSEKVKLLTQQISFKHQDLAKVVREYETERLHVRFQHPDRGDNEGDRKYSAHRLKSLEEIEETFGLDGRLDRIRKQVGVVFPFAVEPAKKESRRPAGEKKEDDDEMPKSIHLVK